MFRDYHLRVGEVIAENGSALPQTRLDETETGAARVVSAVERPESESPPPSTALVDWDMFDGITNPGETVMLLSWPDAARALAWIPRGGTNRRDVRIIRDYGLRNRHEAPQYFPNAPG